MFTKEQLAKWRAMGFSFDDFYDQVAVEAPKKSIKIKYLSVTQDDKMFNVKFEIQSTGLNNKTAQFYLKEHNEILSNSVLSSVKVTIKSDSGSFVSMVSKESIENLSGNFEFGGFEFKGYISCDGVSAESEEFKLESKTKTQKKSTKILIDPKKEKAIALDLTEKQKYQFITTIMGETNNGHKELWDIGWVYFNLVTEYGFEKGMKRSSFFKEKPETYKLFMYYFGQGAEYKDYKMKNGNTISAWVNTDYFKNGLGKNADLIKLFINDFILTSEPLNPYPKWEGQGYWGDMNLLPPKNNEKWFMARTYYWLQLNEKEEKVKYRYVKILEDGYNTSFIFDEKSIIKFFKENPELLPEDKTKVKQFFYEKD